MRLPDNPPEQTADRSSGRPKWHKFLLAGIAFFAVIVAGRSLTLWQARSDVAQCMVSYEVKARELLCEGIGVSVHHGLIVSYRLVEGEELNYAYWYLRPFRKVDFSK